MVKKVTEVEFQNAVDTIFKTHSPYKTGHGNYLYYFIAWFDLDFSDEEFLFFSNLLLEKMTVMYDIGSEVITDEFVLSSNLYGNDGSFMMNLYADKLQLSGECPDYRDGLRKAYDLLCGIIFDFFVNREIGKENYVKQWKKHSK